jgi:DNA-binding NarL/FixJ family response regulator
MTASEVTVPAETPGVPGPRVAIVDDHELLAHSAAFALRAHGIEAHVVEVTSLAEIEAAVLRIQPQAVLLDLHLGPIGLSTPLISSFRAAAIDVVVLTGETDRATWGACIEAGAAALVEKRLSFDELVDRLRRVIAGDTAMPSAERIELLATLQERRSDDNARLEQFSRLTEREAEVLQRLMLGRSAEDIAVEVFVSIATVRSHIRAILQKLGVNSQLAAVAVATGAGWSRPAVDK